MKRRSLALVLTAALIGAVFTASPAKAAVEVPVEPNILDLFGDANYLNDQDPGSVNGISVPENGDNNTGQDAASVSDLGAVWFTNDATNISVHVQTELPHADNTLPLFYRVKVDPGQGSRCLWFQGATDAATGTASLRDTCETAVATSEGELTLEEGPDGTGVMTWKFPLSAHPALEVGKVLATPLAHSRNSIGGVVTAPQVDNTKGGTDYTITAGDGGTEEPPVVEEPEAPKPPKDPCKKLKGKKKKKCIKKNKKPAVCETYAPGEQGAEAETFIVTSAATEEAPMEAEAIVGPGVGGFGSIEGQENPAASKAFYNIQVDPDAEETGLYVRLEFFEFEDYDMTLFNPDGTEAASVGGFNQAPEGPLDGTGAGGHSEQGAEQLDGIKSADCQGYTLMISNPNGLGDLAGPLPLKLWLGEAQYDPAAPPAAKAFVL